MPIGGALDPVPIDIAGIINIAQPRDLGHAGIAVLDQRVHPRRAEAPAERGQCLSGEMLLAEHQHGVLSKDARDPGKGGIVERGQIDADGFGAERLAKRAELRCIGHGRSSEGVSALPGPRPAIHAFPKDICGRIGSTMRPNPVGRRGQGAARLPQNLVYHQAGAHHRFVLMPHTAWHESLRPHAGDIQELQRGRLQLGKPSTSHGACLLSLYRDIRGASDQKESERNAMDEPLLSSGDRIGNDAEILISFTRFCAATNSYKLSDYARIARRVKIPAARCRQRSTLLSEPEGPFGIDGSCACFNVQTGVCNTMEWLTDPQMWVAFLTLTVLELVLGIDNVVFISILAGKLPHAQQPRARTLGLGLAMLLRIALLFALSWIIRLTAPLFTVLGQETLGP